MFSLFFTCWCLCTVLVNNFPVFIIHQKVICLLHEQKKKYLICIYIYTHTHNKVMRNINEYNSPRTTEFQKSTVVTQRVGFGMGMMIESNITKLT